MLYLIQFEGKNTRMIEGKNTRMQFASPVLNRLHGLIAW